ncbi:MAG: carboxypeptidase regulatory-like domain-containing protein [Planctomycetes bacterium]|nr:carboxypeptidase regulatory-like domain-containing protein [Planctomycetota bacterium]
MRSIHVALAVLALAAVAVVGVLFLSPIETVGGDPAQTAASAASPEAGEPLEAPARSGDGPPTPAPKDAGPAVAAQESAAREEVGAAAAAQPGTTFGTVCGIVIDADGRPAPGAKVRLLSRKGSGFALGEPDAETDAQGRFTAKLEVKKKKTMRLRVTRKDRLPLTVPEVVLRKDEVTDIGTIQFAPSGGLEVLVVDSQGRPVPNVQISLDLPRAEIKPVKPSDAMDPAKAGDQVETAFEWMRGERRTDDAGIARFSALPERRMTVKAQLRGLFDTAADSGLEVGFGDFEGGTEEERVEASRKVLRAMRETRAAANQPVPPKDVEIRAGTTQRIEFSMSRLGVLSGRATVRGRAVASEWLTLRSKAQPGGAMLRFMSRFVRTQTDADGKFSFPPVTPGKYVVERGDPGPVMNFDDTDDPLAMGQQFAAAMFEGPPKNDHAREVNVVEGASSWDVDFGGANVEVIVTDADDGLPLAEVEVNLFDTERPSEEKPQKDEKGIAAAMKRFSQLGRRAEQRRPVRLKATTNAKGVVTFQDVESGYFRVSARRSDRPPSAPTDFELGGGGVRQLILKMEKGLEVRGSVNNESGRPVAGAMVFCTTVGGEEEAVPDDFFGMLSGGSAADTTDLKGNFAIKGVPRGGHTIVAWSRGYAPAMMSVSAPSEGNNLFLSPSGSIRVQVRKGGKPARGEFVRLETSGPEAPPIAKALENARGVAQFIPMSWSSSTDEEGVAVIDEVPSADWTVLLGTQLATDQLEKMIAERKSADAQKPEAQDEGAAGDKTQKGTSLEAMEKKLEDLRVQNANSARKRVTVASGQQSIVYIDLPGGDENIRKKK